MGLDMYLYKENYVRNWDHFKPEERYQITVKKNKKVCKDIKPERISYIVEQVGYWRKFNALHSWFIENLANGVDECQRIRVDTDDLKKLLEVLKKVKTIMDKSNVVVKVLEDWNGKPYDHKVYECEDEVKELLSPQQGFFFGSYEIDEWYKQDIDQTVVLLEELINEDSNGLAEYYYQASW
jgi:hypothetical protein